MVGHVGTVYKGLNSTQRIMESVLYGHLQKLRDWLEMDDMYKNEWREDSKDILASWWGIK